MATRKAITLVSGLFQEVNTPTDKLDFAGNTTADLGENTNLYFTNTRARGAVSVTDSGGLGSLAYNSSTGVITYTGPSNSDVRGTLSVASGEGLTYDASTGEFGTNAIPNSQLANSGVTIGSTSVALGATVTNFAGLGQLVMSDAHIGSNGIGGASTINIQAGQIIFEGSTADANETILSAADATGGDKSLILPNESGTILTTASSIPNSQLANNTITFGSTSAGLGSTQANILGLTRLESGEIVAGGSGAATANSITLASGNITFEGSTADANEIILTAVDASGSDKTITLPNATGTVALLSTLSIASGSGLTYNSSTGEFGTNAIPNSQLANSSITIGGTGVALGGSITTFSGLSSVTADAVVTKTGGFRVIDSTDNTKQLAFDASAISGSTTRTLTVPNKNGSILTEVADDTSPQLGGTLDCNDQDVSLTAPGGESILFDASQAQLEFSDSASITFGNHSTTGDYSISYVNGTEFGILAMSGGTQDLVIGSFASGTTTKNLVSKRSNNAIELYFGGSKTAETVSGGFTVTGVCTATSFTGALNSSVTATTQSASDNSTKVATTAYVDNQVTAGAVNEFSDNVFRVKDNSDASKKLAFECSGISGSTTRTMTVPNTDGTISTESFATAIAVALG